jgi:AraC-like DNA-binding protein
MTAPWGFSIEAKAIASFHLLLQGSCWLEVENVKRPIALSSGDFVVLPRGHAHQLRSDRHEWAMPLTEILRANPPADGWRLRHGGGGPATVLLCGGFTLEAREAEIVLSALPPVLRVRGEGGRPADWLGSLIPILREALSSPLPGSRAVVARLTDLLLAQVIRYAFAGDENGDAPPLSALRDPFVGIAMRLMHEQPDHSWTADRLASRVGMSRSAFCAHFRLATGMSPMRYLRQLRLAKAAEYLRKTQAGLIEIAARTGYKSDVALSKAFKKQFTVSPGAYRRQGNGQIPPPERLIRIAQMEADPA